MTSDSYITGEYLDVHPSWHTEDSAWKAGKVLKMLERNQCAPNLVHEVGSGAGAILAELQRSLGPRCRFEGYEISPQAHRLALPRANDRLRFHLRDYLQHTEAHHADLVLLMDVVEHVEDCYGFLRLLRHRARHVAIHVPLDLSAQSVLRKTPEKVRSSAGHVHFFTKDIFLSALRDCGYEVIDWEYTGAATERPSSSFVMALAKWPRKLMFLLSPGLAARLLGGFSLLVLAKPNDSDSPFAR